MKKKIAIMLSALLTVALFTVGAIMVGADATEPTLEINGHALSLSDSIYIKYYVKSTVDGVELIIDGVDDPIAYSYTEMIGGEKYYVFDYKGLAAKNMADDVYAKAHVKVGNKDYYSKTDKYSVLQYAYAKLGKIGNSPTSDEKLKSLLKGVLDYGGLAQTYLGYNTDRLANANWYLVNVIGGTLADGFNSGLYIEGDSVTLTAPEKDADGKSFAYFVDDEGKKVSSPATVGKKNATYTPVYVNYSTGLTFTSNGDGTCYVSGIGTCTDTEIIIPPTSLDGETVVGIGESAFANSTMTEITIPNTVKKVGANAFDGCEKLEKVNFDAKESVWKDVEIAEGNDALENATKYLDGSTLSSGLSYAVNDDGTTCTITGIGGCKSTVLGIPESIDGYTVTAIGEKAFADCTQLTEITIPSTVKTIGTRAFYGCTGITEMTIPESVTSIGTQIFYKATNLTTVNYYSSYYSSDNALLSTGSISKVKFKSTSTAKSMLQQCSNIKEVVLAEGITSIGSWAFYNCTNLTNITIPDSVTSIGVSAFSSCTSLTSITIPDGVTSIGNYAFSGCTSLTSITIPDSVTSIGYGAFDSCTNLKKVYYTGDVESWLKISFNGWAYNPCCYGAELYFNGTLVTKVDIPDTITKIGDYAFSGCTSLTTITIPSSVTSIGNSTFSGCTSLTSITIPDSVTSIGDRAFDSCTNLKKVYYTGDVESWLKISFSNSYSNPCCNGAELYFKGTLVTKVDIPDTITKIGSYAFYNCTSLTSITIPDSVTSIGDRAFRNCPSLTSITIPDSVTSIGYGAFDSCTNLKKVYYTGDVESWLKISFDWASNPCYNGAELYFNNELVTEVDIPDTVEKIGSCSFYGCTSLTNITIPDSVTSIGNQSFRDCTSLTSITIPDSVTNIGDYAFRYCTALTDVYYSGTKEQWNAITIGSNNGKLTSATVHYIKNIVVNDGVYTVVNDVQWGVCVLGESNNWEITMTLKNGISTAEYGLQICGKDDNGDGLILEGDDSFLQVFLTGNDVIRLIGCDNGWGNVDGYQWGNINRSTGLGSNDELTLTVKLNGKNLSYWVDGVQCGDTIVLDDSVIYGNVVTLFMKHTDTSISNVTFKDNNITVIDATGGAAGENKMGDVADVTKKYFAVSYTMLASTYAGDPSDNGCCGLFFGENDNTCIFIPYDGGTTDTQHKLGIWGGNYLVFGNWWGQACIFGSTATAEITPDTEVTILVLGVKGDDGKTTVSAYLNGTQINVWGGDLTAKGDFDGHIGWATRLSGQEATVKFIESDSPISSTVFD